MPVTLPPMPEAIAALPRDTRGYPIPYVADWTSRSELLIITHPQLGSVADCSCRIGHGEPILGEPCLKRARECAKDRLCSTCGRTLAWNMVMAWPSAADDVAPLFTEPANHSDCLAWALRACPFLVTQGRNSGSLDVVTARQYAAKQIRRLSSPIPHTVFVSDMSHEAHRDGGGYLYGYAMAPINRTRTRADEWLSQQRFRP